MDSNNAPAEVPSVCFQRRTSNTILQPTHHRSTRPPLPPHAHHIFIRPMPLPQRRRNILMLTRPLRGHRLLGIILTRRTRPHRAARTIRHRSRIIVTIILGNNSRRRRRRRGVGTGEYIQQRFDDCAVVPDGAFHVLDVFHSHYCFCYAVLFDAGFEFVPVGGGEGCAVLLACMNTLVSRFSVKL